MKLFADYITLDNSDILHVDIEKNHVPKFNCCCMRDCYIKVTKDDITITGFIVERFYQSKNCMETNFNKNNRIDVAKIEKDYLKTKRKFLVGRKYKKIRSGWFELIPTQMKTIKSNNFKLNNLDNANILTEEEYENRF